jgi:hypothetical protein
MQARAKEGREERSGPEMAQAEEEDFITFPIKIIT